jgi:DNA polymerase-1
MLHLYQTGQDIHAATASWVLGVPLSQVTKDDRKKAKAVNFGFVYGMYPRKFVATAFEKYELIFTMDEAAEIRKSFFAQFKGLLPWHARQKRLVHEYRRVQSPLGRIRHLPDIDSGDEGVRREAERQAINSPVQSFASDMTMLSMVEIDRKFRKKNIDGRFISTVHDALLFEVRDDEVARALPIIKRTMENLPLERYFGVTIDVPIVADLKVGRNWGEAVELTEEEAYDYRPPAE